MFKRDKELMLFGLEPNQYSFKGLGMFLLVFIGASIIAAILTPVVHWIVYWINEVSPTSTTKYLLGKKIDLFYDRIRWIPIIVGIPYMMAKCKLFSLKNLGLPFNLLSIKRFFCFYGIGVVIALFIFLLQFSFCNVEYRGFENISLKSIIISAILGGLVVGLLEEIIFRSLIMRCFYTALGSFLGVLLSSLFFAYKHFKVPDSVWAGLPGGAYSDSWYIGWVVAWFDTIGISIDFALIPFLSLSLFGVILCVLYIKTKMLLPSIGFHAGLVTIMLFFKKMFYSGESNYDIYFGTSKITDGIIPFILLIIIFILACRWKPNKNLEEIKQENIIANNIEDEDEIIFEENFENTQEDDTTQSK